MGKNDEAWEKLFEKYRILDEIQRNGYFMISAAQIKKFREPRLMAKFDHKVNLPAIFKRHDLAILPITRGDYIISSFEAYKGLKPEADIPQQILIPSHLQSLALQFVESEAIALNYANACGILAEFLEGCKMMLTPTVSGRMKSGDFEFRIKTASGAKYIRVHNAQIEIDAAYEGVDYLALFEAKRDLSEDFLIRQLYYPFRTWYERVTKPVRPIFMTFSNSVFNLYEYQFRDPGDYNSLQLVNQKSYAITEEINLSDIENILANVSLVPEPPGVPSPQADKMARLINLMELLSEEPMTSQRIAEEYDFNKRQANYYVAAGRYLELFDKINKEVQLSPNGRRIMSLRYKERQLAIVEQILKHKVFREVFNLHLNRGVMPDTPEVIEIMKQAGLHRVNSDKTFERRSSTVTAWVNWILALNNES